MVTDKKRSMIFDKVILVSISLVAFFAWMDTVQIQPFHIINTTEMWDLYTRYTGPAVYVSWILMLILVAVVWFMAFKDKSESIALFAVPAMLLAGGWADILFYIIKGLPFFGTEMPWLFANCWFMRLVAQILGQEVVTSTTLIVSAGLSAIIAFKLYKWLKKAKW